MRSRIGWFGFGIITTVVGLVVGTFLFVGAGGVSMATNARPLPLEQTVARLALHASLDGAADVTDPLPFNDANMVAGVRLYRENCSVCHGIPGRPRTAISRGMFPSPPQLFEKGDMVTDDREGITYWKVTHGIRLSGMPGFRNALSDTQRWQVAMLVAHADRLSSTVRDAFASARSDGPGHHSEMRASPVARVPRR